MQQQPTQKNAKTQKQPPYPRSGRSFKNCFRDTPSPDIERAKKAAPPQSKVKRQSMGQKEIGQKEIDQKQIVGQKEIICQKEIDQIGQQEN